MNLQDHAMELATLGFHVFPLHPETKIPAIKRFPTEATTDPAKIRAWWGQNPNYNIGISTSSFNGGKEALLAVDVDNKDQKGGDETLAALELVGMEFPETFEQSTPTGGRHLIYRVPNAVRQGINVLGPGLDIRSRGGYLVGAGSVLAAGKYSYTPRPIEPAPPHVVESCGRAVDRAPLASTPVEGVELDRAIKRSARYLLEEAPVAKQGEGGDMTTYVVAARVKDFGADQLTAFELMADTWNDRCEPPWDLDALAKKVANAYAYGLERPGAAAPEAQFPPIEPETKAPHPFAKLNETYAYVLGEGSDYVIQETTDERGRFHLKRLDIAAFHRDLAGEKIFFEGKSHSLTRLWLGEKKGVRRSYEGVCFTPGEKPPEKFYNLWRGFAVTPLPPGEKPPARAQAALGAWLEHIERNICQGDKTLAHWFVSYFAHLVQRPFELPQVAVVLRGKKGVGKNAIIDRIGRLLGNAFTTIYDRRHFLGNFNSLIEDKLMIVLDEAFWSGDKQAEGSLKALVTGPTRNIERKNFEPYEIENRLRTVILGNEDWLVPATEDERRFAVFDVGEGRRKDTKFFKEIRLGMESEGGYPLLLRYLLGHDHSDFEVAVAPETEGLRQQKLQSLTPFNQWWRDCLTEGRILGGDFDEGWPESASRERFRLALFAYLDQRNIRWSSASYTSVAIGRLIRAVCPVTNTRYKENDGGKRPKGYVLPSLKEARAAWEAQFGVGEKWEDEE